jgi:hypothetical protein
MGMQPLSALPRSGNGRCQRRDSYGFRLLVGLDVKKTEALKKNIK